MDIPKRLFTSREAAKFLGISERTLFTLRQRGLLSTVNISHRGRRFDLEDLSELIDKMKHHDPDNQDDDPEDDEDGADDEPAGSQGESK